MTTSVFSCRARDAAQHECRCPFYFAWGCFRDFVSKPRDALPPWRVEDAHERAYERVEDARERAYGRVEDARERAYERYAASGTRDR